MDFYEESIGASGGGGGHHRGNERGSPSTVAWVYKNRQMGALFQGGNCTQVK
tara:strand:- start:29 stop:184 length:156 start_codon:yes stop_codon:yes gene_type:complete